MLNVTLRSQKELSAELALRTRAERSKQEEVRGSSGAGSGAGAGAGAGNPGPAGGGTKRRTTSGVPREPSRSAKKSVKKEKLLCICRTPYDNTK